MEENNPKCNHKIDKIEKTFNKDKTNYLYLKRCVLCNAEQVYETSKVDGKMVLIKDGWT